MAVTIGLSLVVRKKNLVSNGFDKYTIPRGKHRSRKNGWPGIFKFGVAPKVLRFDAFFEGCDYKDNNDGDINKLYGVSYGFDNHYRSVRIGWLYRESTKKIEFYVYAYIDGKRHILPLFMNGNIKDLYTFNIVPQSNNSVFVSVIDGSGKYVGSKIVSNIRHNGWFRFKQFPYYGGNNPAPQKMHIYIENLI